MSYGEERVAALLSVITESGVDVEKLSKLKGYRKLMRLTQTHKSATSSLIKDNKCGVNDNIENNRKRNTNSRHNNKSHKWKQDAGANLTDDSESETDGNDTRYCELSCGAHHTSCRSHSVLTWITGCCVALAFFFIHQHELLTHQGFSRFWLTWENVALHAEVVSAE
jgi:hypothetical protein